MQEKIEIIEKEIELIKSRNKSVEIDKAWESSKTRLIFVSLITYFVVIIFFYINNFPEPFLSALVPVIGFILSTLTIPIIKKIWMRNRSK